MGNSRTPSTASVIACSNSWAINTPNEGYMKTLRQQVLNRLIDEALLDQYARELKLGISDEQVKQAIFATPAFQVDGKFDNSRYNGILNQMGMTADQYAQALRNQLTTQQLINGVAGTDFMLKGETLWRRSSL